MATPRLRLGQLLVDARMITAEALEQVLVLQRQDPRRLGTLLVEQGVINETQLTQILSHQLSVPWVSLLHIEFSRQLLNLVPRDVADRYCLVPIYVRHVRGQGQTLYVAMDDPSNEEALRECQSFSGLPVRSMIAPPSDIQNAIRVYYGGAAPKPAAPPTSDPVPPSKPVGDAPRARRSDRPPRGRLPGEGIASPAMDAALQAPAVPTFDAEPETRKLEQARDSQPDEVPTQPVEEPVSAPPAEPVAQPLLVPPPPAHDPPPMEVRPVELPPVAAVPDPVAVEDTAPPSDIPKPRGGKAPRMVSLTLLDGTTITLPAKRRRREEPKRVDSRPARPIGDDDAGLTARDLVAALRAVSHGADATEILGNNVRWEAMFAALLSLLLKKHLIADWEFVDEFKKI